ncbi:MAG TPA: hypothetical protein VK154_03105 [Chitinophagales bacterium]|nr:hypothetical protein [Chitinophagales bacterium]
MKPRTKYHKLVKAVLNYCLIVIWGLSFVSAQCVTSTGSYTDHYLVHKVVLVSSAGTNGAHLPFSYPAKTDQAWEETELDETEASEDHSFEVETLFHILSSEEGLLTRLESNLFEQLTLSIQNRPSVSLFVLFHSWKGYLI